MNPSPLTQMESNIAGYAGMMVGLLGAFIILLFVINWAWYFKLFASIGEVGAFLVQGMSLIQNINARKEYLLTEKRLKEMYASQNITMVNPEIKQEGE